jgi:hypothetical protein
VSTARVVPALDVPEDRHAPLGLGLELGPLEQLESLGPDGAGGIGGRGWRRDEGS